MNIPIQKRFTFFIFTILVLLTFYDKSSAQTSETQGVIKSPESASAFSAGHFENTRKEFCLYFGRILAIEAEANKLFGKSSIHRLEPGRTIVMRNDFDLEALPEQKGILPSKRRYPGRTEVTILERRDSKPGEALYKVKLSGQAETVGILNPSFLENSLPRSYKEEQQKQRLEWTKQKVAEAQKEFFANQENLVHAESVILPLSGWLDCSALEKKKPESPPTIPISAEQFIFGIEKAFKRFGLNVKKENEEIINSEGIAFSKISMGSYLNIFLQFEPKSKHMFAITLELHGSAEIVQKSLLALIDVLANPTGPFQLNKAMLEEITLKLGVHPQETRTAGFTELEGLTFITYKPLLEKDKNSWWLGARPGKPQDSLLFGTGSTLQ